MRILNVDITLNAAAGGGTTERTCQMSRSLADAGFSCSILTTNCGLTQERLNDDLRGVKVIALFCLNRRFYIPLISPFRLLNIVSNFDVIHLMGHWTLINALVYVAARRLGKPYVVCPAGALPVYGRSSGLKRIYNFIIGKKIIRNATRLIAITSDEVDQFKVYGIDRKRISIIPNGINEADLNYADDKSFRQKYGLSGRPFILFVGRLNMIKGPDILLEAFCNIALRIPDYDLVFVGPDNGMLLDLKRISQQRSMEDRIFFLGYLGGKDKSMAYHAADLLAIPSRSEAMSIVVLEAGISGTPVLLTDKCGFKADDAVWTVAPTVDAMQFGLLTALSQPRSMLKEKGDTLRAFVIERYTWRSVIAGYISLYTSIQNTHKP